LTAELGGILKNEMVVAKLITLNIERFVVCSTGEEMEIPEPADSLEAAIKLRDDKQAGDEYETWEIVAEVAA
jgi:hypothetical protein